MGVKSRAKHAKTCHHGLRSNVPNSWQLLICTCQRANKRANQPNVCQLFNLACQHVKEVPIFQIRLPKGVAIFQIFFKIIFQFLNFSIMLNICANFKNIWAILENFAKQKNLNFGICQISLRKNLLRFTEQLFSWCEIELNILFI